MQRVPSLPGRHGPPLPVPEQLRRRGQPPQFPTVPRLDNRVVLLRHRGRSQAASSALAVRPGVYSGGAAVAEVAARSAGVAHGAAESPGVALRNAVSAGRVRGVGPGPRHLADASGRIPAARHRLRRRSEAENPGRNAQLEQQPISEPAARVWRQTRPFVAVASMGHTVVVNRMQEGHLMISVRDGCSSAACRQLVYSACCSCNA